MKHAKPAPHLRDRPLLFAIAVYALYVASVYLVMDILVFWKTEPNSVEGTLKTFVECCLPAIVLALFIKRKQRPFFRIGFSKQGMPRSLLLSLPLILFRLPFSLPLFYSLATQRQTNLTISTVLASVIAGLQPGISEEIVFRAIITGNMVRCWKDRPSGIYRAVFSSAVCFGVSHLSNLTLLVAASASVNVWNFILQTMIQVVYSTGAGVLFAAMFIRTRNLWGSVLAHSLFDILAVLNTAVFSGEASGMETVIESLSAIPDAASIKLTFMLVFVCVGWGGNLIRKSKHNQISSAWAGPQIFDLGVHGNHFRSRKIAEISMRPV